MQFLTFCMAIDKTVRRRFAIMPIIYYFGRCLLTDTRFSRYNNRAITSTVVTIKNAPCWATKRFTPLTGKYISLYLFRSKAAGIYSATISLLRGVRHKTAPTEDYTVYGRSVLVLLNHLVTRYKIWAAPQGRDTDNRTAFYRRRDTEIFVHASMGKTRNHQVLGPGFLLAQAHVACVWISQQTDEAHNGRCAARFGKCWKVGIRKMQTCPCKTSEDVALWPYIADGYGSTRMHWIMFGPEQSRRFLLTSWPYCTTRNATNHLHFYLVGSIWSNLVDPF